MGDLAEHLRGMARYNAWANGQLYAMAAALSEPEWTADCGLFFTSIQGTLNHLLVTDRIWLHRITKTGATYVKLDELPYPQFTDLKAQREAEDARIIAFVDSLDAASLDADFVYANMAGTPQHNPLWQALVHLFNHQTHHRGQAHAGLTRLGKSPSGFDLIAFQRLSRAA
jgi:uncharacterized damage-inducible protein DinB